MYRIRWKKGRRTFESGRTFRTKGLAQKKVRFIRQIDDDLPPSRRDKSLKTYRVVRVPIQRRVIRRRK